jgi:hypothetical protein
MLFALSFFGFRFGDNLQFLFSNDEIQRVERFFLYKKDEIII